MKNYSIENDDFLFLIRNTIADYNSHSNLFDDPKNPLPLCEYVARTVTKEFQKRLLEYIHDNKDPDIRVAFILSDLYKEFGVK
jgi:hypothetical protein